MMNTNTNTNTNNQTNRNNTGAAQPQKTTASQLASASTAKLPRTILVIEDDESFSAVLSFALEQKAHADVFTAANPFEAANILAKQSFDLIITDWRLPELNGYNTLKMAEHGLSVDPRAPDSWFEKVPVIVVTACDKDEVAAERLKKSKFRPLGVISKEQPMEGIIKEITTLYSHGEAKHHFQDQHTASTKNAN